METTTAGMAIIMIARNVMQFNGQQQPGDRGTRGNHDHTRTRTMARR